MKKLSDRLQALIADGEIPLSDAWGKLIDELKDDEAIIVAAEKLVRCKGRYHSEQNYRALAAIFGVTAPDLPPLEGEQEPVADVVAWHKEGEERTCDIRWRRHDVAPGPLYSVPQIPDEATPENIEILASTYAPRGVTYQWDSDECNAAADSWNACRSAMTENKK